jgi:alpha-tubulin suppressor-like RCC1 family protein
MGGGITSTGAPGAAAAVYSIAVSGTDVFVVGFFEMWNSQDCSSVPFPDQGINLAHFTTSGSYFTSPQNHLSLAGSDVTTGWSLVTQPDGTLYVCGQFDTAGTTAANGIAKWNGSGWSPLGTGLDQGGAGYLLAADSNAVYVLGNFGSAGGLPAASAARWVTGQIPDPPCSLSNNVAAGAAHTIVATLGGEVLAWGDNSFYQLGTNTPSQSIYPILDPMVSDIISVSAGNSHSMALRNDGTALVWGNGYNGEFGFNFGDISSYPQAVMTSVISIAAGNYHCVVAKRDGTVWAWGNDLGGGSSYTPVQMPGISHAVAVAAGGNHSLALLSDQTVRAWGANTYGQLGDGTTTTRFSAITVTNSLTGNPLTGIIAIAAADANSFALDINGNVWAWGRGGINGDTTTTQRNKAVKLSSPSNVTAIAAGAYDGYALDSNGTVWSWGLNQYGELGIGTTSNGLTPSPQQINMTHNLRYAQSIGIGSGPAARHALAIQMYDDTLGAWGKNTTGQLGHQTVTTAEPYPVYVEGFDLINGYPPY